MVPPSPLSGSRTFSSPQRVTCPHEAGRPRSLPHPVSHATHLSPAGCLAKAWCPSVTMSAGTNSGESWTWPSAGGECGCSRALGAGLPAWVACLHQKGPPWAPGREKVPGITSQRASWAGGGGGGCLRDAPTWFVNVRRVGVLAPQPQTSSGSDLITPQLGFFIYYSFPFLGSISFFLNNAFNETEFK